MAINSVYNTKDAMSGNPATSSHIPVDVAPPLPDISTVPQNLLSPSEHNNSTSAHNSNTNSVPKIQELSQSSTETVNKVDAFSNANVDAEAGAITAQNPGDLITWDPKTVDLINTTKLRQHIVRLFVVMYSYCECCIDCNGKGVLPAPEGPRRSTQIYLSHIAFIRLQRV